MTNQRRAPEALRLRHYVERRKRAKQLDVNKVHAFDAGCGSEAELLLSDIETLLSLVEAQQPAPSAAGVGNSGFDYKTAADFLNGKTVSDEAMRKFVAASRWAHDDRVGLRATLLSVRGELASREAEIALLKKALMDAEAPQPSPTPQADSQPAHQWGTGYPPLPAAYYLAGGAVRTWDEGQMRAYADETYALRIGAKHA